MVVCGGSASSQERCQAPTTGYPYTKRLHCTPAGTRYLKSVHGNRCTRSFSWTREPAPGQYPDVGTPILRSVIACSIQRQNIILQRFYPKLYKLDVCTQHGEKIIQISRYIWGGLATAIHEHIRWQQSMRCTSPWPCVDASLPRSGATGKQQPQAFLKWYHRSTCVILSKYGGRNHVISTFSHQEKMPGSTAIKQTSPEHCRIRHQP